MKKLITLVMVVFATNMAMAQKETTPTPTANATPLEVAKVKSHSNINNNREAGGGTKVGNGIPAAGETGTKKKFDVGKLFKKK